MSNMELVTKRHLEVVWAAGFLEGEGHFGYQASGRKRGTPVVAVGQNNREPLDRLLRVFPQLRPTTPQLTSAGNTHHEVRCAGAAAAMVMAEVLPHMSERRADQIRAAMERFDLDERERAWKREHCPKGHSNFGYRARPRPGRYCKTCQRDYQRAKAGA